MKICANASCINNVKQNRATYCSRSCARSQPRSPRAIDRDCEKCGATHKRRSKYCSTVCARSANGYRDIELLLIEDSPVSGQHIKSRLIRTNLIKMECSWCGITEWRGLPAPLALDHINGHNRDHRLENLRLLCANCHAQTETFCGKNIGRSKNILV